MHGLKDKHREAICSIFKNCEEIEEVIIYRSCAKGNYLVGSDIDLTLKGNLRPSDLFK